MLADHGERFDAPHRILDPAMAGGSLLDLGTYLTTLATWVLGPAVHVHASGETTPSGVNGQAAIVLTHAGNATSVLHCSIVGRTPMTAAISGTAATLTIPAPFHGPGDLHLMSADGSRTITWTDPEPIGHQALYYTAVETARCIDAGLTCSPLLSSPGSARSTPSRGRSAKPTRPCGDHAGERAPMRRLSSRAVRRI